MYSEVRDELLANGIGIRMVSIGKPEVGKALCEHLEIKNGESIELGIHLSSFQITDTRRYFQ